ncbi:hypothetical protein JCM16303_004094 [Sporobolomyces ruberrimus]
MALPPPLVPTYENFLRLAKALSPDLVEEEEPVRKCLGEMKRTLVASTPGVWKQYQVLTVERQLHGRPVPVSCAKILFNAAAAALSYATKLRDHQEKTLQILKSEVAQIHVAGCKRPFHCKLIRDLQHDLATLTIDDWRIVCGSFPPSTMFENVGDSLAESLLKELGTALHLCKHPEAEVYSNVVYYAQQVEAELREYQWQLFQCRAQSIPTTSDIPKVDELRTSLYGISQDYFKPVTFRDWHGHRDSMNLSKWISQLVAPLGQES